MIYALPARPREAEVRKVADAFRNDRECRRRLRRLWTGPEGIMPLELLVVPVLRYLEEDERDWEAWAEVVIEGGDVVARERGWLT